MPLYFSMAFSFSETFASLSSYGELRVLVSLIGLYGGLRSSSFSVFFVNSAALLSTFGVVSGVATSLGLFVEVGVGFAAVVFGVSFKDGVFGATVVCLLGGSGAGAYAVVVVLLF